MREKIQTITNESDAFRLIIITITSFGDFLILILHVFRCLYPNPLWFSFDSPSIGWRCGEEGRKGQAIINYGSLTPSPDTGSYCQMLLIERVLDFGSGVILPILMWAIPILRFLPW